MRENSLDLCEIMPALRRKNISIREIYNSYSWRYGEINRIYVGTSFCGELFIKTILEDMEYIASCFGNKIRVNLTIPVFTESCFIQGKSIINTLLDRFADLIDEIMQIPAHLTTHSAKSRSVFPDITERVSASADQ